jgi:hypothetical protein
MTIVIHSFIFEDNEVADELFVVVLFDDDEVLGRVIFDMFIIFIVCALFPNIKNTLIKMKTTIIDFIFIFYL